jgi:hypothetical protein
LGPGCGPRNHQKRQPTAALREANSSPRELWVPDSRSVGTKCGRILRTVQHGPDSSNCQHRGDRYVESLAGVTVTLSTVPVQHWLTGRGEVAPQSVRRHQERKRHGHVTVRTGEILLSRPGWDSGHSLVRNDLDGQIGDVAPLEARQLKDPEEER